MEIRIAGNFFGGKYNLRAVNAQKKFTELLVDELKYHSASLLDDLVVTFEDSPVYRFRVTKSEPEVVSSFVRIDYQKDEIFDMQLVAEILQELLGGEFDVIFSEVKTYAVSDFFKIETLQ
jgi:hypothetical protein